MINNLKRTQIYLIFLVSLTFFSCKQNNKPEISNIQLDLKIERFDKDLFSGKDKNVTEVSKSLNSKYGDFYNDFTMKMVGNPSYTHEEVLQSLYLDQAYTDLNSEIDSVFKSLDAQEKDLTETFKYIKFYYPKVKIPRFIGFISGFSYQTPIGNDYLGIGLDMYLGSDNPFYKGIVENIPLYLSKRFTPENIVPRTVEAFAFEELFLEPDDNRSLLKKMIFRGKILYFLDQVLPEKFNEEIKIGYTTEQLAWAKNFEGDIWAYFLENKFLYETDYQKIQVFLSEGPFTPGLGENRESAPKLGVFTGWQIVKKYMKENPDVTLQNLMLEEDAQKILSKSNYKPKQ